MYVAKQKSDGLTPDLYKVIVVQGVQKDAEGKSTVRFRKTQLGAQATEAGLIPQGFFQIEIVGRPQFYEENGVQYEIPGSSDTQTLVIFENQYKNLYNTIMSKITAENGYKEIGEVKSIVAGVNAQNQPVTIMTRNVELNAFLLPGNWTEKPTKPYYRMNRDATGKLDHFYATKRQDDGSYKKEKAISEDLKFFVHPDEHCDVVFNRLRKTLVDPYLVPGVKPDSPETIVKEEEHVEGEVVDVVETAPPEIQGQAGGQLAQAQAQ